MQLVHHDAAQARKHRGGLGIGEQQRQGFRRGQQDVGRVQALAYPSVLGRIAGPGLAAHGQPHLLDGGAQVARDIGGERLQRRDVKGVQAAAGGALELDQAGQEAGQGLAAAGGGDEENGFLLRRCLQHGELMVVGPPAAALEPGVKARRQRGLAPTPT